MRERPSGASPVYYTPNAKKHAHTCAGRMMYGIIVYYRVRGGES